jgi:hypothetical protein
VPSSVAFSSIVENVAAVISPLRASSGRSRRQRQKRKVFMTEEG